MRSGDKLKLSSLPYNNAYSHQTCLFAEDLWEGPIKVTRLHVNHVANW